MIDLQDASQDEPHHHNECEGESEQHDPSRILNLEGFMAPLK
jgi:hypothetical protein